MEKLPEGPLALSLSGGGSKGAYIVGLLQYLIEVKQRRDFKMIYGTSTGALAGALVGAMVATNDLSYLYELIKIYGEVLTGDVLSPNYEAAYNAAGGETGGELAVLGLSVINGGISIYDTAPLLKLIDRFITPEIWDKIIEAGQKTDSDLGWPIEIGFCATNLQTGESEIITNRTHPDRNILRRALLASANQPVFMPPIKVKTDSEDQYVDGGLIDYNPIEKLFESDLLNEVSGILSISLDAPGADPNPIQHEKVDTVFFRTLQILSRNVQEEDLKTAQLWNVLLKMKEFLNNDQWEMFIDQLHITSKDFIKEHLGRKVYVPIVHLFPSDPIIMDSLRFKQPDMKNLIKKGFQDGAKFLD